MARHPHKRRYWLAPVALPLTLVAGVAFADDPEEGFDLEAFEQQMMQQAAEDAANYDSVYLPTPDVVYGEDGPQPQPRSPAPRIIFLNFDGEQIQCNNSYTDDARTNQSWVCGAYAGAGPMQYAAYNGSAAQKQQVIDATKAHWNAFNVSLVTSRPGSGNYEMAMIGPTNFIGGSVLGVAPLDCFDNLKVNVVYAFNGAGHSVAITATTISQELAHAFGLEHTSNQSDIMYPSANGGNKSFVDSCTSFTNGSQCTSQHNQNCSGQQNSYQDLLALFGPAMPDNEDPTVNITAPEDGAAVMVGSSFDIVVEANDDVGINIVELWINGDLAGSKSAGPFEWPAMNIPEGEHEFYAVARDDWGNEATSAVVTVYATADGETGTGDGDGDGGDGDGDGGDGDGGDGDGGGSSGAYPGDAFPPGYGQNYGDETGCACTTSNGLPTGATLMLLLVGAPLLRRRRD
jgi:MYXO-CTERM domain-containing protein